MIKLSANLLNNMGDNGAGELLRAITFVGKGYGCYRNFDVREDAALLNQDDRMEIINRLFASDVPEQEIKFVIDVSEGYIFKEEGLTIDVFWYWDGDGTLYFRVEDDEGIVIMELVNHDCKCDQDWRRVE